MSDDHTHARPSLLLAKHENAHREHLHQHHLFHNRRQAAETVVQNLVTEVVATVSVIQQIDVDANGSIYSTELVSVVTGEAGPAASPAVTATTTATTPSENASPSPSPGPTDQLTAAGNTALGVSSSLSLNTSSGASAATTSTPSIPIYSSLSASNTTLISSATPSPNYANSTRSSTSSLSSLTYLSSSDSIISYDEVPSSTSYAYSPSSSSYTQTYTTDSSTSTSQPTIIVAGSGTGAGSAATNTAASSHDGNSTSPVSTPVVVGGVVGGVAGVAILIFLLMFLLRWKKRHSSMLLLGNGDGTEGYGTREVPPSQPSGGMSQRRSIAQVVPAALATLTGHNKRASQKTVSSTAESERGFYRVSGRKLTSVLQTGGDGYGGGPEEATWSGGSFYRDSQGFYGGRPGGPSGAGGTIPEMPLSPPLGVSPLRESGVPVMRPSPARTPVTEHGPFFPTPAPPPPTTPGTPGGQGPSQPGSGDSPHRPPRPRTFENPFADPSNPLPPLQRPDHLGRSHPSQDGSHASRFTEEV